MNRNKVPLFNLRSLPTLRLLEYLMAMRLLPCVLFFLFYKGFDDDREGCSFTFKQQGDKNRSRFFQYAINIFILNVLFVCLINRFATRNICN